MEKAIIGLIYLLVVIPYALYLQYCLLHFINKFW